MSVRSSALALTAAAGLVLTGCGGAATAPPKPAAGDAKVEDVGAPLYAVKPDAKLPAAAAQGSEPIIIPNCTVQNEERQQVGSEVDGRIELIAVRDDAIDPADPNCAYHPRDVNKQVKYRLLKEGDRVAARQEICFLDDQVVTTKMKAAQRSKDAATDVQAAATDGVKYSTEKLKLTKKALDEGTGSFADYLQDQITLTRFQENLAQARSTIAKAEADFEEAQVMIRKHRITSSVNGIIRSISRRAGEIVKSSDKILEIQATDVVRLEGNLDVQYASLVKRGMTVSVEPAVLNAPYKSHSRHRSDVTGVVVTHNPGRPLVVSTAADGSVWVWDATRQSSPHFLPHPVPVRTVATTPAGVKPVLAVTGADDGKIRVWDLTDPDKLPSEPRAVAEGHTAAVGAIAFSPDGKFAASAASRDIFVWDVAQAKKLYALPAEHRDAVTALNFTPQGTLVTASKDRSLIVWKLGAEKAASVKSIDHRVGAVDVVQTTRDGARVVFDQDRNRLDLVGLADKQTAGQVLNVGPTATFATFAVFNQDDTLLATGGGEGELRGGLQIWTVPAAGARGTEAARLFTPGRVAVTAAAFTTAKEHPFIAVGTEKGTVHLWKPPADGRKTYTGKVVYVDSTDPRYVTVRVEMDNRELNLLDRSSATVIINPQ